VGAVVAYAYWRQRHADDLLKQRDATIAEMTKTMIELVVPTLEKTASSSNEVRHALERIIEAQRRGDYASTDERRIRER
jgi:ribosomal protein L17